MQQTILTLSQEVEYLSVRNSKLLTDLKRKEPLYDVYVKTSEELIKLRQAHTVLISMIQSENINIKQNINNQVVAQESDRGHHNQQYSSRQSMIENSILHDENQNNKMAANHP